MQKGTKVTEKLYYYGSVRSFRAIKAMSGEGIELWIA
jgi:hypothetical protein